MIVYVCMYPFNVFVCVCVCVLPMSCWFDRNAGVAADHRWNVRFHNSDSLLLMGYKLLCDLPRRSHEAQRRQKMSHPTRYNRHLFFVLVNTNTDVEQNWYLYGTDVFWTIKLYFWTIKVGYIYFILTFLPQAVCSPAKRVSRKYFLEMDL